MALKVVVGKQTPHVNGAIAGAARRLRQAKAAAWSAYIAVKEFAVVSRESDVHEKALNYSWQYPSTNHWWDGWEGSLAGWCSVAPGLSERHGCVTLRGHASATYTTTGEVVGGRIDSGVDGSVNLNTVETR